MLIGASEIEYIDKGSGEEYIITMPNGKRALLSIVGNRYDGGFANVNCL
jgi:hypothetical protein